MGVGKLLGKIGTAAGAINPAIGAAAGIAGLIGQGNGVKKQEEANKRQAELNYQYGEKAASEADKRARKMYEDYESPAAMRKQLEAAGYNPAIIGGISGGTGSGAQGSGAAGMQAPDVAGSRNAQMNAIQTAMQGLQMQTMKSQIDLNEAGAAKAKAEAGKIGGVDTEVAKGQLAMLAAQTKNEGIKSDILAVESTIAKATEQSQINSAYATLTNLIEDIGVKREAQISAQKTREQIDAQITEIRKRTEAIGTQITGYKLENIVKYGTLQEQIALQGIMAIAEKSAQIRNMEQDMINKQYQAIAQLVDIENWERKLPALTQVVNYLTALTTGGKTATNAGENASKGITSIVQLIGTIIDPLNNLKW